jgi:hypothetical protein
MIITYLLHGSQQTSMVLRNSAIFIEKMKTVGASNFICYSYACQRCNNGLVQIDEDGTTEPCTHCETGRDYARMTATQVAEVEAMKFPF